MAGVAQYGPSPTGLFDSVRFITAAVGVHGERFFEKA
jgi:hypothetical protein